MDLLGLELVAAVVDAAADVVAVGSAVVDFFVFGFAVVVFIG